MEPSEEYRLIQDGVEVASVYGPSGDARREIVHYAMVYAQDGPVQIEKREGRRWKQING
mgnify:CR=1 FL=1